MKYEHITNKHLTYEEREYIEIGLTKGRNFTQIAKDLNKHRTTIMREVKKHQFRKNPTWFNNSKNLCKNKIKCGKFNCTEKEKCYEEEICFKLTKPPYTCNACKQKNECRKIKYYYYAKFANDEYMETLKLSRYGINLSKEEVYEIDKLITPLIKEKHQSISHIYANHPDEIWFSKATMYNYVDLGVFSFKNIDLPRKVKYKKRKENEKQRIRRETAIRKNRTYEDFKEYISRNPECSIVEMDTVEGIKGVIEKNHEYIRYVLPKGSSFDKLTQEKVNILMSNINSTNRDILNGKTPYEVIQSTLDEKIINKLGVIKIEADEVNLSPNLLRKKVIEYEI